MKNLILPIFYHCQGVTIDQGHSTKTKSLYKLCDKNIQFLSGNIFIANIKNNTISHLAETASAIVPCRIQKTLINLS